MLDFKYDIDFQYPTHVYLNVTDDCNLMCKYCFVQQHPNYMSFKTAKKTVDWIVQNQKRKIALKSSYTNNFCKLYFFGGEPMLCYNSIIKPIVLYCQQTYPNLFSFGMTTNGTLLTQESIDFFYNNKFNILLSIDGAEYTQNYNRPCKNHKNTSFNLIQKNLSYLLYRFPYITFRSTIYADTVDKTYENYLYAEQLNFKKYIGMVDYRHQSLWTDERIKILKQEITKIYYYRLQQILNKQQVLENKIFNSCLTNFYYLYNNKLNYFHPEEKTTLKRCGLGTGSVSVGWNGNIYGCQEQTSQNDQSIFFIGNIFSNGIDIEKHQKFLKFYYDDQLILLELSKTNSTINNYIEQIIKSQSFTNNHCHLCQTSDSFYYFK